MSSAAETGPVRRGGGGARDAGGSRGGPTRRGGQAGGSRGGGRRANFGGSLTGSTNSSDVNNTTRNRTRGPPRGKSTTNTRNEQEHKQDAKSDQQQDNSQQLSQDDTAPAPTLADTASQEDQDELPPEGDLCFICAEPVKLYSIAPCDHRTCHVCALRLRVLYKKDECTFCKTTIDNLIFTTSPTKTFKDFTPSDVPFVDKKLPIHFETKEAMEETSLLLRFNCPDPQCEVACRNWKAFSDHIRIQHKRLTCELCIENKKIFAHEHTMHTSQSLNAHMQKDHRYCGFCNIHEYGDDELFVHMRDAHEQCHICKARGGEAERWKYYKNYRKLEEHFRDAHYLCPFKDCLDQKFIVFETEVDFKAHQVAEHGNELSSKEKRDALRIQANFSYGDAGAESSRTGGSGGGRTGGRKGNRERGSAAGRDAEDGEGPSSSRDILGVSALASRAHVPGAGPANHQSRRAQFGSGLTSGDAPRRGGGAAAGSNTSGGQDHSDEQTTIQRHQAFIDQVSSAMKGSEARITSFRSSVRAFKHGESSARDLISTIHSLLGGDLDECVPLIKGLVELLDDEDKKQAIKNEWNQYRVERTQFPSLVPTSQTAGSSSSSLTPGTGYAAAGASAGAGGRGGNTLRSIKKSSAASSSAVWDNVERAASATSGHGAGRPVALREHFPSLGSQSTNSGSTSVPGSLAHAVSTNAALRSSAASATPWSASVNASPVASGTSTPKPYVARAAGAGTSSSSSGRNVNTNSASAFPSLPTNAAKASINAHKKALFANKNTSAVGGGSGKHSPNHNAGTSTSANGSGTSTPWSPQVGRIDDLTSPTHEHASASASASGGLNSLDGLSEALVASQQQQTSAAAGGGQGAGKKKKQKGTPLMALGGVHRG